MMGRRPQPDVVRMLTLVPWLLERPGTSLAATAAAFATDEATIRAELEHLDFCGLPGLGGGALFDVTIVGDRVSVRMADELRYPMRPTPHEALRLLLIATAAERVAGSEVPALRSAITKLHRALGVTPGAVTVLDAEPDGAVLTARRAIADRVRVRFSYRGRADTAPVTRTVEPWAIELSEGAWYLHGHDEGAGAGRVFRLDRATELVATDEPSTAEVPGSLPHPTYEPADDDLEVELRLAPSALWLLDAVLVDGTEEDGDALHVRLRTGSPEWLARLVLMTAGGAEVLEPPELRERVRSRAQDALHRLRRTEGSGTWEPSP
jgi:predicted DNA-binding transcriptional regulator YafY